MSRADAERDKASVVELENIGANSAQAPKPLQSERSITIRYITHSFHEWNRGPASGASESSWVDASTVGAGA